MDIMPDELELSTRIPEKSILGREWSAIKKHRDVYRQAFESSSDKMAFDMAAYRRANMALDRFIDFWLHRIRSAQDEYLTPRAIFSLHTHELRLVGEHPLSRHTIKRIWQRHAIMRYREILAEGTYRISRYNPVLLHSIQSKWRMFMVEINGWTRLQTAPFDGSQACHSMMQMLYACHEGAVCNE